MHTFILFLTLQVLLFSGAWAQSLDGWDSGRTMDPVVLNKVLIQKAALDYVESFYEGDTAKLYRGVARHVSKSGYYKTKENDLYQFEDMSFDEMEKYVLTVKTKKDVPDGVIKKVEILDYLDQVAVAKVTAWWGKDYLCLGKEKNQWKVIKVLWQSHS